MSKPKPDHPQFCLETQIIVTDLQSTFITLTMFTAWAHFLERVGIGANCLPLVIFKR